MGTILHKKYRFCCILVFFVAFYSVALAALPDFETTRLKSTGGAGVGSILMDESSVLNPASLAFFNISSLYFQKTDVTVTPSYESRSVAPESQQTAVIASDASRKVGGSIAYVKGTHGHSYRKRVSFSLAHPAGIRSAMGVTYRRTSDQLSADGENFTNKNYNQLIFGVAHAISSSTTFGIVVIDPQKKIEDDAKVILGFQYSYKNFASFMLDLESDYTSKFADSMMYKGALQVRVLSDVLLRIGSFKDSDNKEKGTGVGIGWVQPRLVVDVGFKNTHKSSGEWIKENSFSVSYRF